MFSKYILFTWLIFVLEICAGDKPCWPRAVTGESVICVCNATYCDEIVREAPTEGRYVAYTSSEGGSRFLKTTGDIITNSTASCVTTLTLDPTKTHQTIEGFGGAVTDAAGINWLNLTDPDLKQKVIDSYFSSKGLEYNMVRTPIGGTDFSTHAYAYNELPQNDAALSNFSLSFEDFNYKIPMIKAILEAAERDIHIVSTTWSPPPWMKTNHAFYGFSRLKPEYYQTYADYHLKYLQEYDKQGIKIWGITTTNEPINGVVPVESFNSLGWSPEHMGEWIVNNLGPTIRNSSFADLKIITVDDERITIPIWFNKLLSNNPAALSYIDGIGVHYYSDMIAPASILSVVAEAHPEKFILATEACEGSYPWQTEKVHLGSWDRAKNYILDIIDDLNHSVTGWIDWNLCLNAHGGPNWARNFVDSPIIVYPENKEFIKQPMFYGLGHFSKFIPRGSKRITVKEEKPLFSSSIENVAFMTPNNTLVTVLYNKGKAREVCVKVGEKTVTLNMEPKSVLTLEMLL